jgi:L,D-transpeptidase ErfK/SrfK
MNIVVRRLSAAPLLLAVAATSGCVFVPREDGVEAPAAAAAPVAPSRDAPRLEPLETRHLAVAPGQDVVGAMQVLFTRYEDTFAGIARPYNVGYDELRAANPGVDVWLPGEQTPVYLPTASVLPDAPREGIVVNVAAMRLYYFTDEKDAATGERALSVTTHPIGIGRVEWATPLGEATVTEKVRDPAWYPPASVRKEHAEKGDPLPAVVPPGPDNPLGAHALALSMPGYLLHGTNKPAGVGMRVSHGCIRLYPEDIAAIFERVPRGTKVRIVDQPVLAGWRNGELYLEVHKPLDEDTRDIAAEAERVVARALERGGAAAAGIELDHALIAKIAAEQRGIPFPVRKSSRTPEQYLVAAARVVENIARLAEREQTASTAVEAL